MLLLLLPMLLGIPVAESSTSISSEGTCDGGNTAVLVRHARMRGERPAWAGKTDARRCSDMCKGNMNATGGFFPCAGFNLHSGPMPLCEFFAVQPSPSPPFPWTSREFVYYYEKACLNISLECRPSAFSFDVIPSLSLSSSILASLPASSPTECAQLCLQLNCPSARFESAKGECSILAESLRTGSIGRREGVVHIENHCIPKALFCPAGRIISALLRNSDIAPFGFPVGMHSLRECQRECVQSRLFSCRSFLFSPSSSECFLSPETSQLAVPSDNLHLYELFCVPESASSIVDSCNRPYAFERLPTTKSSAKAMLNTLNNSSSESCLAACLLDARCLSLNYDVTTRSCTLLPSARTSELAPQLMPDENTDYFELSCPRSSPVFGMKDDRLPPRLAARRERTTTAAPVVTTTKCSWKSDLFLPHSVFRQHARSLHHIHIASLARCESLCTDTPTCRSYAFSDNRQECFLSTSPLVKGKEEGAMIQANKDFNLYVYTRSSEDTRAFPVLLPEEDAADESVEIEEEEVEETTKKPDSDDPFLSLDEGPPDNSIFDLQSALFGDDITNSTELPAPSTRSSTSSTRTSALSTRPSTVTVTLAAEIEAMHRNETTEEGRRRPSWEWEGGDGVEPRLTGEEEGVGLVPPGSMHVNAECTAHGVNVSLTFNETLMPYTGAVYAVDRYDACRVFVDRAPEASLFIPRPRENTCCNAIEIAGHLSVLLVVSSDRIVPHDVTTAEDIFFQIRCRYGEGEAKDDESKATIIGGPNMSPLSDGEVLTAAEKKKQVWLELTRDGRPVESAAVGDKLTARLFSQLPAERIRVTECVATQAGGHGTPATITLISQGCPVHPRVMSEMLIVNGSWQAEMSAFRLEGSRHVDIVCLVQICNTAVCPATNQSCKADRDRRSVHLSSRSFLEEVEGRLEINDDPPRIISEPRPQLSFDFPMCMPSSTYLLLWSLLLLVLLSLLCSICALRCRRKRRGCEDFTRPRQ